MTQFTFKGVKQINNRISINTTFTFTIRISAFFLSAGVPNGEFPERLIAKCRSWFFFTCGRFCKLTGGTEGTLKIGRQMLPLEASQVWSIRPCTSQWPKIRLVHRNTHFYMPSGQWNWVLQKVWWPADWPIKSEVIKIVWNKLQIVGQRIHF